MAIVSMIGIRYAKPGQKFQYQGLTTECKTCPVRQVCQNLRPGREYVVKGVREKTHFCPIHEDQAVQVVELEEAPLFTTILERKTMGTSFTWETPQCGPYIGCPNFHLCFPPSIQHGKSYKIKQVGEKVECPVGFKLKRVEVANP